MPSLPDTDEDIRQLRARLKTLDRLLANEEADSLPPQQEEQFYRDAKVVRAELGELLEE